MNYDLLKTACTLYHVSLMGNLVGTAFFWATNWREELKQMEDLFFILFSVLAHTLPLLLNLFDLAITRAAIYEKEFKSLLLYNGVYILCNWFWTTREGKAIYPYLSWKDTNTFYLLFITIIFTTTIFFVGAKVTEGRVRHRVKKRE